MERGGAAIRDTWHATHFWVPTDRLGNNISNSSPSASDIKNVQALVSHPQYHDWKSRQIHVPHYDSTVYIACTVNRRICPSFRHHREEPNAPYCKGSVLLRTHTLTQSKANMFHVSVPSFPNSAFNQMNKHSLLPFTEGFLFPHMAFSSLEAWEHLEEQFASPSQRASSPCHCGISSLS